MITALLEGNKRFVETVFEKEREYFAELAKSQRPTVLWIGCSDSRVPVNTITQTRAGEVFTLRNVGNIVATNDWSLSAVLEFTINHLNIPDVVICGHYNCGAINALLNESPDDRYVPIWLNNACKALERVDDQLRAMRTKVSDEQRRRLIEEENVRLQLEHLMEYPFVRRAIEEGKLSAHGWMYDVDTGEIKVLQKNTIVCLR